MKVQLVVDVMLPPPFLSLFQVINDHISFISNTKILVISCYVLIKIYVKHILLALVANQSESHCFILRLLNALMYTVMSKFVI